MSNNRGGELGYRSRQEGRGGDVASLRGDKQSSEGELKRARSVGWSKGGELARRFVSLGLNSK